MTYFFGTYTSVLLVLASLVCANNGVVRAEDPFDIDINELIDLAVAQIEDPIDKPISTVAICRNDTLAFEDENPDVSDAMFDYFGSMNIVGLGGENENSMMARMFGSNKNMGMSFGSEEKEIYRQACDAAGGYFLETTSENITMTCDWSSISITVGNLAGCNANTDECRENSIESVLQESMDCIGMMKCAWNDPPKPPSSTTTTTTTTTSTTEVTDTTDSSSPTTGLRVFSGLWLIGLLVGVVV